MSLRCLVNPTDLSNELGDNFLPPRVGKSVAPSIRQTKAKHKHLNLDDSNKLFQQIQNPNVNSRQVTLNQQLLQDQYRSLETPKKPHVTNISLNHSLIGDDANPANFTLLSPIQDSGYNPKIMPINSP